MHCVAGFSTDSVSPVFSTSEKYACYTHKRFMCHYYVFKTNIPSIRAICDAACEIPAKDAAIYFELGSQRSTGVKMGITKLFGDLEPLMYRLHCPTMILQESKQKYVYFDVFGCIAIKTTSRKLHYFALHHRASVARLSGKFLFSGVIYGHEGVKGCV